MTWQSWNLQFIEMVPRDLLDQLVWIYNSLSQIFSEFLGLPHFHEYWSIEWGLSKKKTFLSMMITNEKLIGLGHVKLKDIGEPWAALWIFECMLYIWAFMYRFEAVQICKYLKKFKHPILVFFSLQSLKMLYNHPTLEKTSLKKTLKTQNDPHEHYECM